MAVGTLEKKAVAPSVISRGSVCPKQEALPQLEREHHEVSLYQLVEPRGHSVPSFFYDMAVVCTLGVWIFLISLLLKTLE